MQSAVMNSIIMVNVLLMFTYFWVVVARTDPADLAALRSLRNQWQNTPPNWVKGDPCDRRWEGIYCNDSRVIEIILPGTNLAGPLPEDILLLSELQILDLSNNRGLTGPLPSNIGNLTNLVNLVLVGCNFSGPIPGSIGSLQKLTHLFLNTNHFNGNMPHSIGNLTNLIWLDLSENELDGTLPVSNTTTPGLDMLLNANHFHLANNKFSGEIPPRLFSSRMALMHVVLNGNQLNGSIPETLGLVQNLTVIRLDRNFFSGSVPQNLSMLTRVTELYLANNDLSGPIPDLTGMNFLAYVDLSNNSFDALAVPQWFETLPSITTLVMENTRLEGNISTTLFSVPQLQTLVLNNNQLNGTVEIPANISRNLRLLDLRNNSIDGFSSRVYNKTIMLDENPFCLRPEAAGICNTSQPSQYLNFIPLQDCAPLTCFSDAILASDCERPYLGSLIFRSFNFSDLENMLNYAFLNYTLQHHLASRVSIDRVCLVSSMIDANGYLVMNISFFPPDGAYFNRTGVSTVGNVLNNHIYDLPYGPYYYIDLPYTSFPGQSKNTALIIGLSVCGSVLVVLTISAGVYAYRQRKIAQRAAKLNNPFLSWNKGNIPQLKGARWFSFEDVKQCTSNFSYGSEIGVGGYGKVYMGRLSTGELVAIKRAKVGSMQGALEFKSEIELLSRVHHKNVVKLVGFCYDKGEQMLIYEFVPNGSLREALSGKSGVRLNWGRRLKIALGAAKGLAYLHELADPPIIHRDIKSDNILLGDHLDAKVADFGLSIPFSEDRAQLTTQVKGTVGYLDPEYYMTQILTEKSDVYSYGVVMLELVTGRLPLEKNTYVVRVVRETLKETGSINNLVDAAIRSDTLIGMEEFVKLAMKCLQDTGDERPSMSEVVKEIEKMIEASNPNYNAESTTTSASFDVEESGYPYSSNGSFDSRINSPFLR